MNKKILLDAYKAAHNYAVKHAWNNAYRDEVIAEFPAYVVQRMIETCDDKWYGRHWFIDFGRLKFGRKRDETETRFDFNMRLGFSPDMTDVLDHYAYGGKYDPGYRHFEETHDALIFFRENLPRQEADIVAMKVLYDLDANEIANQFKCSPFFVKQVLQKSLYLLKRKHRARKIKAEAIAAIEEKNQVDEHQKHEPSSQNDSC